MIKDLLGQPFFQVTLPVMVTFVVTIWFASRSQNLLLKDIITRLGRMENFLTDHEKRIATLEGAKWK